MAQLSVTETSGKMWEEKYILGEGWFINVFLYLLQLNQFEAYQQ